MHWLDPNYLPVTKGTLHQFLLNPHGDADGMILTDGTEIHFPPHMAKEIVAAIHPGQTVTVHVSSLATPMSLRLCRWRAPRASSSSITVPRMTMRSAGRRSTKPS